MATTAEEALAAALKKFKLRLTPKELQDFQFTSAQDVTRALYSIQVDKERLRESMNMNRLKSFLEAMEQFSKVIEIFPNSSIYVAFVWGPFKFILLTAKNWADTFDELLGAYQQIGEHMPLLEQYSAIFHYSPAMRNILALIYQDILDFHRGALRFFTKKVWRQVFRSTWKDFQTRFAGILDNLKRHKEFLAEQAQILHLANYQADREAVLRHFRDHELHREEMRAFRERQIEQNRDLQRRKILNWLARPESVTQDHESFCGRRELFQGTGEWILKHDKVYNWLNTDIPTNSLLWISGIPGAGKTILASAIIEACGKIPSSTTAYYYCKRDDPQRNEALSIYRGILHQFLNTERDLIPYCHDKYDASGEATLSSINMAQNLIKLLCASMAKGFIVVDGVDECDLPHRRLLLSFVTKLVEQCDETAPGKIRVLLVSQDFEDIRKSLGAATVFELRAENDKDIEKYVYTRLGELTSPDRHFDLSEEEFDNIKRKTLRRSKGMFLFAELVINNLVAQPSLGHLLNEVEDYNFPTKLSEAYESILKRLRNSYDGPWDVPCKLLGWMVCAQRPLQRREINAALSIDLDNTTFDFRKGNLVGNIRELCGSLVRTIGDRVELVHSTAIIYIRQSSHIHVPKVECELATMCLQYLTFPCFEKVLPEPELESYTLAGYLALEDYAISKWSHHVQAVLNLGDQVYPPTTRLLEFTDFEMAIQGFSSFYEEDLKQETMHQKAIEACTRFQRLDCFDELLTIWSHVCSNEEKGFEARNDVSLKRLDKALKRNRALLEDLSTRRPDDFTQYYSPQAFKCSKITCFYFYKGFGNAKIRDQHIRKHTRPFLCPHAECNIGGFGFANNKDLERHIKNFHPEIADLENHFAKATRQSTNATFKCNHCPKTFTRNFHLKNHMRSHYGERPFACGECGKSFTRSNDCRRHEKIHWKK